MTMMKWSSMIKLLPGVQGLESRVNDVVIAPAQDANRFKGSVIFFPGDVQDLHNIQIKHRDNSRHIEWCLEKTCDLLASCFPQRNVLVIRPSRKELGTFSCFDNFVQSDHMGNPSYSSSHAGIQHLSTLLDNVSRTTATDHDADHALRSLGPLTLIGFSKGIVVLNQLVHELSNLSRLGQALSEHLKFDRFVFLDGGHNGGPGNIYVTSRQILEDFVSLKIAVDIRLTPYQDRDSRRPWIHKECNAFTRVLTHLQADVTRKVYFENETPSIETHFNVIKTMENQCWDDH